MENPTAIIAVEGLYTTRTLEVSDTANIEEQSSWIVISST